MLSLKLLMVKIKEEMQVEQNGGCGFLEGAGSEQCLAPALAYTCLVTPVTTRQLEHGRLWKSMGLFMSRCGLIGGNFTDLEPD